MIRYLLQRASQVDSRNLMLCREMHFTDVCGINDLQINLRILYETVTNE